MNTEWECRKSCGVSMPHWHQYDTGQIQYVQKDCFYCHCSAKLTFTENVKKICADCENDYNKRE